MGSHNESGGGYFSRIDTAFEIIFNVSARRLPNDVYSIWSITDLNDYIKYVDEKMKNANKKRNPSFNQDSIESLIGEGGAL